MTKKQKMKWELIRIWKGSSGSTADRKTSANNYQAKIAYPNWFLGPQWPRMNDDVCKP